MPGSSVVSPEKGWPQGKSKKKNKEQQGRYIHEYTPIPLLVYLIYHTSMTYVDEDEETFILPRKYEYTFMD